jgi:hypothetical protein
MVFNKLIRTKYEVTKESLRMTVPISHGKGTTRQHMEMSSSLNSSFAGRGASAKKNNRCPDDPRAELEV